MSIIKMVALLVWVAFALPVFAAPPAAEGEPLFRQRCQICHSVAAVGPAGVGPNLKAVIGRKAGTSAFNYSLAMKTSTIIWTKPNLDRFLASPSKTIPGTRMAFALTDAKQRAAVIEYLGRVK